MGNLFKQAGNQFDYNFKVGERLKVKSTFVVGDTVIEEGEEIMIKGRITRGSKAKSSGSTHYNIMHNDNEFEIPYSSLLRLTGKDDEIELIKIEQGIHISDNDSTNTDFVKSLIISLILLIVLIVCVILRTL